MDVQFVWNIVSVVGMYVLGALIFNYVLGINDRKHVRFLSGALPICFRNRKELAPEASTYTYAFWLWPIAFTLAVCLLFIACIVYALRWIVRFPGRYIQWCVSHQEKDDSDSPSVPMSRTG